MAILIEELNGLSFEEIEEIMEEMTNDEPVEVGGNIYMVPEEMASMVEMLIRNYLGVDELPGN